MNKRKTVLERIQANVAIDPATGCWLWRGGLLSKGGYAWLRDGGRTLTGHRALWIELHGPLERHEFVCHRCDVRHCCNPDHLWLGTHRDNLADMVAKGRNVRGERVPQAKLTAELVRSIRADSRWPRQIAADYGVTQSTVSDIKRRKSWAHVP